MKRHRVVAATGAPLVVTSTYIALSTSIAHLAVGAFLMGLSSGMYFVAANPLASELFPETLSRVIGIHGMSSQFAAVVAPLLVLYAVRWTNLPEAGEADRNLLAAGRAQSRVVLTGVVGVAVVPFVLYRLGRLPSGGRE